MENARAPQTDDRASLLDALLTEGGGGTELVLVYPVATRRGRQLPARAARGRAPDIE